MWKYDVRIASLALVMATLKRESLYHIGFGFGHGFLCGEIVVIDVLTSLDDPFEDDSEVFMSHVREFRETLPQAFLDRFIVLTDALARLEAEERRKMADPSRASQ
jgi:hypothetical protein